MKKNKMLQNDTFSSLSPEEVLSPTQVTVLAALLAGNTITDAATAAGVERVTVHRWMREDFCFQAALNRTRRELRRETYGRLAQLADKAVGCIKQAIEAGDAKVALEIVKGMGFLAPSPIGSECAGELEAEAAEEHKRHLRKMLLAGLFEPDEIRGVAAELTDYEENAVPG